MRGDLQDFHRVNDANSEYVTLSPLSAVQVPATLVLVFSNKQVHWRLGASFFMLLLHILVLTCPSGHKCAKMSSEHSNILLDLPMAFYIQFKRFLRVKSKIKMVLLIHAKTKAVQTAWLIMLGIWIINMIVFPIYIPILFLWLIVFSCPFSILLIEK